MLEIKEGVSFLGLSPQMAVVLTIAHAIYQKEEIDLVVTSGTEGRHGRSSKHFIGNAIDLRIRNLPAGVIGDVVSTLKRALGREFDVVLEGHHIHIEFDPKVGVNQ